MGHVKITTGTASARKALMLQNVMARNSFGPQDNRSQAKRDTDQAQSASPKNSRK